MSLVTLPFVLSSLFSNGLQSVATISAVPFQRITIRCYNFCRSFSTDSNPLLQFLPFPFQRITIRCYNFCRFLFNGLKSVATISSVPSGTFWYFLIFQNGTLTDNSIIYPKEPAARPNCRAGIYSRPCRLTGREIPT
jgi:hypothetical protein